MLERVASLFMSTGWSIGPQRKAPTNAPVEVGTFGTPFVRSTSRVIIAGDSDAVYKAMSLVPFPNLKL